MSCADFFRTQGLTLKDPVTNLTKAVFDEGIGCINANQQYCGKDCTDLTKSAEACYSCVEQVGSCPDPSCRDKPTNCTQDPTNSCCANAPTQAGCCPQARSAVKCGNCVAARGGGAQTIADFEACLNDTSGLSTTTIIIIAVCCGVALIIIIAVIVIVVRVRKRAAERNKLTARLQKQGVDKRLIRDVSNLNYSQINSNVFKDVNTKLALQRASQRVKNVPPATNVQMTHTLNDDTDDTTPLLNNLPTEARSRVNSNNNVHLFN